MGWWQRGGSVPVLGSPNPLLAPTRTRQIGRVVRFRILPRLAVPKQAADRCVPVQQQRCVAARDSSEEHEQVRQPSVHSSGVDRLRRRGTCGDVSAVNDLVAARHEFTELRQRRGHDGHGFPTEPASRQMSHHVRRRIEGQPFEIRPNGVGDDVIDGSAAKRREAPKPKLLCSQRVFGSGQRDVVQHVLGCVWQSHLPDRAQKGLPLWRA